VRIGDATAVGEQPLSDLAVNDTALAGQGAGNGISDSRGQARIEAVRVDAEIDGHARQQRRGQIGHLNDELAAPLRTLLSHQSVRTG
jgi:hypothetical protein